MSFYSKVKTTMMSLLGSQENLEAIEKLKYGEHISVFHDPNTEEKVVITKHFFDNLVEAAKLSFDFQGIVDANHDVLFSHFDGHVPIYRNQNIANSISSGLLDDFAKKG